MILSLQNKLKIIGRSFIGNIKKYELGMTLQKFLLMTINCLEVLTFCKKVFSSILTYPQQSYFITFGSFPPLKNESVFILFLLLIFCKPHLHAHWSFFTPWKWLTFPQYADQLINWKSDIIFLIFYFWTLYFLLCLSKERKNGEKYL